MERASEPGTRRRGRIVFSLLAVLLLVGVVPLALVAWKLIGTNREALETSQREYQLLLASTMARKFDSHVQSLRAQLYGVARLAGAVVATGRDADGEVRDLLAGVADERMLHLRYSDLKRLNVESSGADLPEGLEPLFVTGFTKVAEGLADGGDPGLEDVAVSEPVLLSTRPPRAVVVMTAPVVAAGRFRGAIFAIADLQAVWDEVAASHRGGHGLFAVDARGRLFTSAGLRGAAPGDPMGRSGIVRKFLHKPGRATETAPFLWNEDGEGPEAGEPEQFLGSYDVTSEGWGVFVQAKRSDVYLPVKAMIKETLRWGLGAVALAVVAAIVFAGTLSVPINRLAEASRAFATGDHSARVAVRSRNEIGELAETFNRMASELESHIESLKVAARENEDLFWGTADALTAAIDAKDPYTKGHSARVRDYSVTLARHCGLTPEKIREVRASSLLHDVGKIGVDDAILKKPGHLTDEEFAVMKKHPSIGAAIMEPIRQMQPMIPGLRSHHERWSGGGYPDDLSGEQIPLLARIIAVADSFDAMTTDRPYQQRMSFEAAAARINELSGRAFDVQVVAAFNDAYLAGEFRPEPAHAASHQEAVPV